MKIDLSTVFLIVLCVIPGIFAQRSRSLVFPRSFVEQGASGELGELVALGVSTHGLLILLAALIFFGAGCFHSNTPLYFFRKLDAFPASQWSASHPLEALSICTCYIFLSFSVSHWLGLMYGIWREKAPITSRLLRNAKWLKRLGIVGLLGEQPIIYELLSPAATGSGAAPSVFLELEMKSGLGFYAGQLSQFAIVKDEEPHKPVFLIDASYRRSRDEPYISLEGDGILLDLADAVQIGIKQVEQ